jgi:hypothetical protein
MADDVKPRNGQARERAENPETPRTARQENPIHKEGRFGGWAFRAFAPLVAGIALHCGSPAENEQDADADSTEEDVAAEVEDVSDAPDMAEDADRAEDTLDTHDEAAEDAPPEAEEDAGPDEATPDVDGDAEPEDVLEDVTDEVEVIEDILPEAEADAYDCTEDVRIVETPEVLPDPVCGGTQTSVDLDEVRGWVGADCESTSTTSTRVGERLDLDPDRDTADLGCIRARTTRTPQGDEVLVAVTETSLETATGIACADMTVGDNLDSGPTGYKFRMTDARADQAVGTVFDLDWHLVRNVRVYPTGAPTAIDSSTGLISADLNPGAATARICFIGLPTMVRNNGDVETWATHGDFTFSTNVSGTTMAGWGWNL